MINFGSSLPVDDLRLYCDRYNKTSSDFNELCDIRRRIWEDMDLFDQHMHNLFFRLFYLFSADYKTDRQLRKYIRDCWKNRFDSNRIFDGYIRFYFDIADKYSESEQYYIFSRLMMFYHVYVI